MQAIDYIISFLSTTICAIAHTNDCWLALTSHKTAL